MPTHRHTGRRGLLTAAATACTTTGLALLAMAFAPQQQPPPVPPPSAARGESEVPSSATEGRGDPGREAMARSEPSRITGRSIGLSAVVTPVGLADDGSIALPGDADRAGWYDGSVTPGEAGNAVLVAHVDSTSGPAAFYELGALEEGDRVTVRRRDGSTARFTVTGIAVHPRDEMPAAVYRPTLRPRLTLITCTEWDPEARAYRSNLVVTSRLTGGRG